MNMHWRGRSLDGARREIKRLRILVHSMDCEVRELERQRLLLAKLASRTPLFDNPLVVMEAERMRDEVLRSRGLIK